jgi:uncharacterized protein YndB with AHSA1/START domain
MRMHLEHHYDADVETVFALITDADFMARKYTAIASTNVAVDKSEEADGGCELVLKRTVTVDLPGFAKRVMTPSNTAIQTENWAAAAADGTRVCTYRVEIQGMPSTVSGTVTLSADGDRTRQDIDADVKVSIPLIGGKLEKFAISAGTNDLAAQAVFTAAELDGGSDGASGSA